MKLIIDIPKDIYNHIFSDAEIMIYGGMRSGKTLLATLLRSIRNGIPFDEQEPKTGHWIDVDGIWFKCSECNAHMKMIPEYKEYYCPNCGARMVESQESEG